MRYQDITHEDMKNGDGLRVVLWVSGCDHYCDNCQNPITWNPNDGLIFDNRAKREIYRELCKPWVSGLTLSGGDPLYCTNRQTIYNLCKWVKKKFPNKTIWLYTGYKWEDLTDHTFMKKPLLKYVDILIDGMFIPELKDNNYPWAGSTNQRIIDVQKSLQAGEIVRYVDRKEGWYYRRIFRAENH